MKQLYETKTPERILRHSDMMKASWDREIPLHLLPMNVGRRIENVFASEGLRTFRDLKDLFGHEIYLESEEPKLKFGRMWRLGKSSIEEICILLDSQWPGWRTNEGEPND